MLKFLRRHRTVVLISLVAAIAGLVVFDAGRGMLTSSPEDAIIKVNGKKITQRQFDRLFNQIQRQQKETKPEDRQRLMNMTLQDLVRTEVFSQEADKYGIVITDEELFRQMAQAQAFQTNGQFDQRRYLEVVRNVFQMTPNEFEAMQRRDLAARHLHYLIASSVFVSEDAVQREAARQDKEKGAKADDVATIRRNVREKQAGLVLQDWLTQLNSIYKISPISESFQQRMAAGAPK